MKKALISLGVLVFATIIISCGKVQGETKIVSPEEMQTLLRLDNVQLVDVRTPEEFKEGYINNAENIDFFSPTFSEDIKKLDKNKPILVYCRSGRRSAKCTKILLEAGFVEVYNLQGGILKWKQEGFKIKL